jgi:predicted DNA-binding protein
MMIRTQVYLPKKLYQRIQLKAEQENLPAAEMVRELLEKGLATL